MQNCVETKNRHESRLLSQPGVQGVGIGYKWSRGVQTTKPAILVFVEKKLNKEQLASTQTAPKMISSQIDNIATDIIETGRIVKQGLSERIRPARPGYSIGHRKVTAGTFGGLFRDKDGDIVILSNNHVLAAENSGKAGDPIYQPGPIDSNGSLEWLGWKDPLLNLPYIATLKEFVSLKASGNVQDTAIAVVPPGMLPYVSSQYPAANYYLTGFAEPVVNTQVHKYGRTTGFTTSKIIATNASFTIGYDFGDARFNDCVVTSAMSKGGDSGSIIMDQQRRAVAILFAGSSRVTIANPIRYAVSTYGLSIIDKVNPAPPAPSPPPSTSQFANYKWTQRVGDGSIEQSSNSLKITSRSHCYNYIETPLSNFRVIELVCNTGTDGGATWGPGIVVAWNGGMIKVNLRRNGKFGGYYNTNYQFDGDNVQPSTNYRLRFRRTATHIIGEVGNMGGNMITMVAIPISLFSFNGAVLRVGKTGELGNNVNHSDPGENGSCSFMNLRIE